jgi:hypothetical protein
VNDIEHVLAALYSLLEDSERLGLSRTARLRIVAIIGELEEAIAKRAAAGERPPEGPPR